MNTVKSSLVHFPGESTNNELIKDQPKSTSEHVHVIYIDLPDKSNNMLTQHKLKYGEYHHLFIYIRC